LDNLSNSLRCDTTRCRQACLRMHDQKGFSL